MSLEMSAGPAHPLSPRVPVRLRVLLALLGCFFVAAMVGAALAPSLVIKHPLFLLALNPGFRHLVLVSGHVDPLPFFVVAGLRLFGSDPIQYLLGRWYGDATLAWIERRSPRAGRLVRRIEVAFSRAGIVFLFLVPDGLFCLLAGASRIRPLTFVLVDVAGTLGMLTLVRLFGLRYAGGVRRVLDFVDQNVALLTLLSICAVIASAAWRRRRARLPLRR